MQNEIYPCLWFDGNAKQAAEFYCSIFLDSKITTDTHMVINWELWGKKFMGLNGGPIFKINPSISIFVNCKTVEQTDEIYNGLAAGGEPLMAIGKYDWSERYGWIKDKYGLTWQVMLNTEEKICPALLFTGDKFGKAEEAINLYTGIFDNSSINVMQHYPEQDTFWGARFGMLKDKFGLSWQIIPANMGKIMTDPEKGQRAMAAMMKMVKIDIATLENA